MCLPHALENFSCAIRTYSRFSRVDHIAPVHICVGVTHLDVATPYGANEDTFVYLINSADAFLKTKDKNSPSHAPTIYKNANDLL